MIWDLCPRLVGRGNRSKITEGPVLGSLSYVKQSWDFFTFRNSDRLAGRKFPVQRGWYLPPQKIPLAENRFLEAGNGAENTKEKSRQCFTQSETTSTTWCWYKINQPPHKIFMYIYSLRKCVAFIGITIHFNQNVWIFFSMFLTMCHTLFHTMYRFFTVSFIKIYGF